MRSLRYYFGIGTDSFWLNPLYFGVFLIVAVITTVTILRFFSVI